MSWYITYEMKKVVKSCPDAPLEKKKECMLSELNLKGSNKVQVRNYIPSSNIKPGFLNLYQELT